PVDLAGERRNGDFVRAMIAAGHVAACHDLSDGGLLVALAEMAMAGGRGARLDPPLHHPRPTPAPVAGEGRVGAFPPLSNAWLFGEDQARYLIETAVPGAVLAAAENAGICAQRIGIVQHTALTVPDGGAISIAQLTGANESWLPG